MNKTTEALNLAEEALNAMLTHMGMDEDEWTKPTFNQAREALAAIRAALAGQEKQEPDKPLYRKALREMLDAHEQAEQSQLADASLEPVAWHHPQCEGQCIACLIEKAVQDAYGTQGRDYMLRHINAATVRTKDLTGQDLCDLEIAVGWKGDSYDFEVIVKTVIAKFKEKQL